MKQRRCLWFPLLLILTVPQAVLAQPEVDPRVQKLESRIQDLERRVAALEDELDARKATAPVSADKVNWRKLKKGMTESDVESLLGSPTKVDAFGPLTIWRYGNHGGEVKFDGNGRTVTGWHEP